MFATRFELRYQSTAKLLLTVFSANFEASPTFGILMCRYEKCWGCQVVITDNPVLKKFFEESNESNEKLYNLNT